ncbi:unnamed protein product, partial [Iphiclides podalirius]
MARHASRRAPISSGGRAIFKKATAGEGTAAVGPGRIDCGRSRAPSRLCLFLLRCAPVRPGTERARQGSAIESFDSLQRHHCLFTQATTLMNIDWTPQLLPAKQVAWSESYKPPAIKSGRQRSVGAFSVRPRPLLSDVAPEN